MATSPNRDTDYTATFATACAEIALQALADVDGNVKAAVGRWLDLVHQPQFRDHALADFIAAVAISSGSGADQTTRETQRIRVAPVPETPPADDASDHTSRETQVTAVASSPAGDLSAGRVAATIEARRQARIAATRKVLQQEARVTSGLYLIERNGQRILFDSIKVSSINRRIRHYGKHAWGAGFQYNLLICARERIKKIAYIPPDAEIWDIFSINEREEMGKAAINTQSLPMFLMPEALAPHA